MNLFSIRFNGAFVLILQAFFLQLLWSPNHDYLNRLPDYLSLTAAIFLALFAALGMAWLRPIGWLLGMLVQGICLLTAIIIRFWEPDLIVPAQLTLLYGICAVLYLNSHTVRRAFTRPSSRTNGAN